MDNIKEEIVVREDEHGNKQTIIIRTIQKEIIVEKENKFIDSLKRARKAYFERNRDKINEHRSERQRKKYNEDPEFREKVKRKQREYYLKKKALKNSSE